MADEPKVLPAEQISSFQRRRERPVTKNEPAFDPNWKVADSAALKYAEEEVKRS